MMVRLKPLVFSIYTVFASISLPLVKEIFLLVFSLPQRKLFLDFRRLILSLVILYFLLTGVFLTSAEIYSVLNDLSIFVVVLVFILSRGREDAQKGADTFPTYIGAAYLIAFFVTIILHGEIFYVLDNRSRIHLPFGTASGAMMAVIVLAVLLFREKMTLLDGMLVAIILILILLSGARMPVFICSWLVLFFVFRRRLGKTKIRLVTFTFASLLLLLVALLYSYTSGVNSSGRFALWLVVVLEPWTLFGNGFGAIHELLSSLSTSSDFEQPHSDFLRIFYNHGIIGLFLVSMFYIIWAFHLSFRRVVEQVPFLIICFGFMLTDNFMIYPFCYGLVLLGLNNACK